MKNFRVPLTLLFLTPAIFAQDAASAAPGDITPNTTVAVQRTDEELEQLLAPIALYPDALIALILPAATVPTDIVLAARHLQDNPGDRSQIEHRAWDESVKSLTNYPDIIKWMDENLQWTRQVGEAFTVQPADVMQAVQRLRAKARAAGTLKDTPQQQIISEQQVIRIVPAQPDIIYVPQYQPEVVFVDRPVYYSHSFLTFGIGVPVGSWLAYDCDWRHNRIWIGDRHRRWTGHNWHRPLVPFAPTYARHSHDQFKSPHVRQWRPTRAPRITVTSSNRFRSEVARPAPLGFASSRPASFNDRIPGYRDSASSRSHSVRDSGFSRSNTVRDSGSSRFRGSSASSRPTVTPPVAPALPHNFSPGFRGESIGPQISNPVVAPPLPTARANALTTRQASTTAVEAPSHVRRPGSEGFRDFGNRSRNFRSSQSVVTPPLPVAPALPMATPPRSAQPAGPHMNRSFSSRAATPPVVPAMPVHRSSPAAPAAVGPVAPQAAPQAVQQAAPVQRRGGEARGHRGAPGRRSS